MTVQEGSESVARSATLRPYRELGPDELSATVAWRHDNSLEGRQLQVLQQRHEEIVGDVAVYDRRASYSDSVGSAEAREEPVHRWFYYKEGFSPRLAPTLVRDLSLPDSAMVVDPFAGVATTQLSLAASGCQVIGVEYSPLAHFVGNAKICALGLDPDELEKRAAGLSLRAQANATWPTLSSFNNPDIFEPKRLSDLISLRESIRKDEGMSADQKSFFMLALAGVIEDASGVMKDGRALRVLGKRRRRRNSLSVSGGSHRDGSVPVESLFQQQVEAMIHDLKGLDFSAQEREQLAHYRGDARNLDLVRAPNFSGFRPESVDAFIYSPPYLNCIDYSEVYKLELWLLGFVNNSDEFRDLRQGTLRSHPSVRFECSYPLPQGGAPIFDLIETEAAFLERHLARRDAGLTLRTYFEDMYRVLQEQFRLLAPGGSVACVLANSTFSKRVSEGGKSEELWRMPIASDVYLAKIAEAIGFVDVEVWLSRTLRPRNVSTGEARESILVARKPS